jgi:hypothetical protein
MMTLTQPTQRQIVLHSIASQPIVPQSIRQNLLFAQQRLRACDIPFHLAALSYLRIVCAAMRTYQRIDGITPPVTSKQPYLNLVYQLLEQSVDWWTLCSISETGCLISSDRQIQALLQPLNTFAEQILECHSVN